MTKASKHTPTIAVWLVLAVFFYGCAGGLFSDGYKTYLDASGEVVGLYPVHFDRTVQTGIKALADIEGVVLDQRVAGQETIVEARGADGSPLRLRFVKEGRNLTVVRVRTGRFGYHNRAYSDQFHVYLAARLKHHERNSTATSNSGGSNPPPEDAPMAMRTPQTTSGPSAGSSPGTAGAPATLTSRTDPKPPWPDYIIFFEKNSNIPPPEALEVLNKAANRMKNSPDTVIAISGFADTDEDPQEMHLVSESRTLAVKSYLIGRGISSSRIRTVWHGSQFADPIPDDKSRHRRVEIRLMRGL